MAEPRAMASETDALKLPPHSLEAEQAVLGGLMLENRAWEQVGDRITEEDFYRRDHRVIFRGIAALAEGNQPLDVVTLSEWLKSHELLEDAGGLAYLGALARDTPSAANIQAYADIVRERSVLRQLIRAGTEVVTSAFQPEGRDSKELLDNAERIIFEIAEQTGRHRQGFVGGHRLQSGQQHQAQQSGDQRDGRGSHGHTFLVMEFGMVQVGAAHPPKGFTGPARTGRAMPLHSRYVG